MLHKFRRCRTYSCSLTFQLLVCFLFFSFVVKKHIGEDLIEHDGSCETETFEIANKGKQCWPQSSCQAKKNILFFKTHKTGSSTVQNIFMRYGDRNNLTFVLPRPDHYFGHPQPFHRSMVKINRPLAEIRKIDFIASPYNIFAHHARFNYNEMKFIMPNDTIFVTILRDPVCLMESLFCYYRVDVQKNEKCKDSVTRFFSSWPNASAPDFLLTKRVQKRFGFNQMCYDLGVEPKDFNNSDMIVEFAKEIDEKFDLVMILDYIDQSLILLQDLLCWSLNDILVFKLNARPTQERCDFPNEIQKKIIQFNAADKILYDFFVEKFRLRLSDFNPLIMEKRLSCLNNATTIMNHLCLEGKRPSNEVLASVTKMCKDFTLPIEEKEAIDKMCSELTISELKYTDILRKKSMNGL